VATAMQGPPSSGRVSATGSTRQPADARARRHDVAEPQPILYAVRQPLRFAFGWSGRPDGAVLQAIPWSESSVCLTGPCVGDAGAVSVEHLAGSPAGEPHEVGFGAAGR